MSLLLIFTQHTSEAFNIEIVAVVELLVFADFD